VPENTGGVRPPQTHDRLLVPAAGAATAWILSDQGPRAAALALIAFSGATLLLPSDDSRPPLHGLSKAAKPLLGTLLFVLLELASGRQLLSSSGVSLLLVVTAAGQLAAAAVSRPTLRARAPVMLAVIGSPRAAAALARELHTAGVHGYRVSGSVSVNAKGASATAEESAQDHDLPGSSPPELGSIHELPDVIERCGIDMLVIASDAPRYRVLEEISHSCLGLPVTVWELSELYEEIFGHVPLSEINAAWFRHVMDPGSSPLAPASKRALDLVLAGMAGLVLLPVALIAGFLVRLDGGPALFRQTRVGERGTPFTILKLRTMRHGADSGWAVADDERITRLGRFLRQAHLDEIPQLLNVLKGDMSLVGPRPEQPGYVERLERSIPFYTRRHAMKPGITGWAQVSCGYAGSELGSAWKVAHDLYYLRHRSVTFDLFIMWRTVRKVLSRSGHAPEPAPTPFVGQLPRTAENSLTTSDVGR